MQSSANATGLLDDLRQRGGDRLQRILGVASLRPAEMREQDDLAALVGNFGDRRCDALEPGRVGDAAILHRHVEVDAQQHALALYVDVIEGAECSGTLTLLRIVAPMVRAASAVEPRTAETCRAILESAPVAARTSGMTIRLIQSSFPIATAVSAMRLEKPHSLSYQDITRTSVPFCTLVWSMWKVDECGSWLKSIETLGAVV